jgi:hypothetical protein
VSPPPLLSTEGGAEINKENDHHPPDTIESKERDASHFTNYPGQFLPSTMYVMNSVMFNLFLSPYPIINTKAISKNLVHFSDTLCKGPDGMSGFAGDTSISA